MAAAQSVPAPQPQQEISDFGRVGGVLFSPGATFTDIAKKPSWIIPIVLLTLAGLGVAYFMNQKMDWAAFNRHQLEQSSRWEQMSEDQRNTSVQMGAKISPAIAWVAGGAVSILSALIIAFVYWLAFNLLKGAQLRYGQAMGIVSYAFIPGLIGAILTIVVLALKRYGDVDPQRMLATSVAAFLPSDAPKWEVSLGGSLELFWIWTVVLIALGFSKANPKKIPSGSAFGIVFGLWILFVLLKVGISAAF